MTCFPADRDDPDHFARLTVDLGCHDRDCLLIDTGGVPRLNCAEIGLAGLIALPGFPPFLAQEIGRGDKRIGLIVEIHLAIAIAVNAVLKRVARQELGMAQFAVFRTFRID